MPAVAPVHTSGEKRLPILTFAATLAMITYLDRVCISQAAPFMQQELALSDKQMGLAFSAFAWAYALFEIPGGWLGDLIGPRKVLLRVVILWSLFTAATGYVWGAVSLIVVRFLFGMGEAGCFPNLTKSFMTWLPPKERTHAQAVTWLSARWAGALTPLLVIWVMSLLSWRRVFPVFALFGLLWACLFQRRFRNVPVPNAREKSTARIPWSSLLTSRTVWLLWIQYFCLTYGWFFYVTWLPTYLKETRGLQLDHNRLTLWLQNMLQQGLSPDTVHRVLVATLAGVPLFLGGIGAMVAGWLTPRVAKRLGSVSKTRQALAIAGFGGAAVLLVLSFYIRDPLLGIVALGLASFCNDLTMPGSWSTCMDVGGDYAGTLSGSMNMMGSVGAATAPLVIGILLEQTHRNWALPFWLGGLAYGIGGLCWFWIRVDEKRLS